MKNLFTTSIAVCIALFADAQIWKAPQPSTTQTIKQTAMEVVNKFFICFNF